MAQLPRGLQEAAEASIKSYQTQIERFNEVIDAPTHASAKRALSALFESNEDWIAEALQLLISAREESIRVLSEGLTAEGD